MSENIAWKRYTSLFLEVIHADNGGRFGVDYLEVQLQENTSGLMNLYVTDGFKYLEARYGLELDDAIKLGERFLKGV